jgi:hypothetical protein
LVEESLALAGAIRADRQWRARAVTLYWNACFRLTGVVERWHGRERRAPHAVLNFGCGNHFLDGAVNADLFAPHRFLLRKRRPDLYWRGTTQFPAYEQFFQHIVCEHVIEHMLPDDMLKLIEGLYGVLAPGGEIVLSFPDLATILEQARRPSPASAAVDLNSAIYRHGHRFMYDSVLVSDLLRSAGFESLRTGSRSEMPFAERLLESREPQSVYVAARRPSHASGRRLTESIVQV